MNDKDKQRFRFMGDGYVLSYNVAIDNSFREKFFITKKEAKERAEEFKDLSYVGVTSIKKVYEYYEWIS